MADQLTHYDENGASRMVDVGDKPTTVRIARASGRIRIAESTMALVRSGEVAKGNVLEVARLAGIMGAKQTASLIPLCHPLPLDAISMEFTFPDSQTIELIAEAKTTGRTGVEMEALTAVSVAALTIYDMCKSVDRGITIDQIQLDSKSGGRSGTYQRALHDTDPSTCAPKLRHENIAPKED